MKIKDIKWKIILTLVLILYAVLAYIIPLQCPFYSLFKVKCPGCGMTRALISAIRLNFGQAFSYHIMFWSVPLLYLCFMRDGRLFKNKYLNFSFYILVLVGFMVNWIII